MTDDRYGSRYTRTALSLSPVLDATAYGATGDGVTNDTPALLAALTAMPTTGGTLYLPPGKTYLINNLTIPNRQNILILGSPSAVLKKGANGPLITTPSSGWGLHLTFEDVAIDGNGANFTGVGISVGNSTAWFHYNNGRIRDTTSHCIDFTTSGAGEQCTVHGTDLAVYLGADGEANASVACIRLPNDTANAGNRNFSNVQASGGLLFDDYGSENSHFVQCVARNIELSHAAAGFPHKLTMVGSRLASIGAAINLRGTQNTFIGNILAGNLQLEASAANGTYVGNVVAGDVLADATTSNNVVSGNRPSTGVSTDSGSNLFDLSALGSGAATGDVIQYVGGKFVRRSRIQLIADLSTNDPLKPTSVIAETIPRSSGGFADANPLVSGSCLIQGIVLPAGAVIATINWITGTVPLTRGSNADSHVWFALLDSAFTILRTSADDTSGAMAANTKIAKALSSSYTTPTAGLYYVGIMVNIGTGGSPVLPRLVQASQFNQAIAALAPWVSANFGSALTTPPANGTVLTLGGTHTGAHYATVA